MIKLGKYNTLKAFRESDFGWYLIDQEGTEEILLPKKFVPEEFSENDEIEVFIFNDSEDRATATTQKPKAIAGDFAYLRVVSTTDIGAFVDWGLDKDLLVPFSEQREDMEYESYYIVYVYIDVATDRLAASTKWQNYIEKEDIELEEGQAVDLLIADRTPIGVKAIINNKYAGLVFQNEIFADIRTGDRVKGFIKKIREDGKIDLSLQKQGYKNVVSDISQKIMNELENQGGMLHLTDKSPPEEIYHHLQMSKKNFKKAIGGLYKQKLIKLEKDGIYLITKK